MPIVLYLLYSYILQILICRVVVCRAAGWVFGVAFGNNEDHALSSTGEQNAIVVENISESSLAIGRK